MLISGRVTWRRRLLLLALLLGCVGPAVAGDAKALKLRFPKVVIPAGAAVELCAFVRIPLATAFDTDSYEIRHRGVGRGLSLAHFLVYAYQGDDLSGFDSDQVVSSRACLDLGPADRDARQLVASGAAARSRGQLPSGTAFRFTPAGGDRAIGFVLDADFLNGSGKTRTASSQVVLHRARPGSVKRVLQPILERTAEQALLVPPGEVRSTEVATAAWNAAHIGQPILRDAWGPGLATLGAPAPSGDACVLRLSGHFHKRSRFFGVDFVDGEGTVVPSSGIANPFEPGRKHLFGTADYTDPGELRPTPPRLVRTGESLHFGCWVDNGVGAPPRLGCEESDGVVPGTVRIDGGAPAKPCPATGTSPAACPATDPAYPGRSFTGRCVEADVVAGTSPDDEVCQLAGFYYDAASAGGCDLSAEPALPR